MSDPTVTCPSCGDEHAAPNGDPNFLRREISKCDVCDARIVYGDLAPRLVVEPGTFDTIDGPKPSMTIRIQDPRTKTDVYVINIDPRHGFQLGQNLISMVRV